MLLSFDRKASRAGLLKQDWNEHETGTSGRHRDAVGRFFDVLCETAPTVPGYPDVKVLPVDSAAKPVTPAAQAAVLTMREQLSENLKKAGYTNVKVVPEAFLVEAKNKAGEQVTMFLSSRFDDGLYRARSQRSGHEDRATGDQVVATGRAADSKSSQAP